MTPDKTSPSLLKKKEGRKKQIQSFCDISKFFKALTDNVLERKVDFLSFTLFVSEKRKQKTWMMLWKRS